jgi:hypothetical protein
MMATTATAVVVVVARSVGEVGGEVGGVVSGKVSGMVGGCVLCLTPTYRRNCTRNMKTATLRLLEGINGLYVISLSCVITLR